MYEETNYNISCVFKEHKKCHNISITETSVNKQFTRTTKRKRSFFIKHYSVLPNKRRTE